MKKELIAKRARGERRKRRVRAGVVGRGVPRMTIFRSNRQIWVQVIDDGGGKTLVAASSKEVEGKGTKVDQAEAVGELVAKKAGKAGVKKVVFDRGSYRYHGRVKAVAEGAKKGGLVI